MRIWLLSSMLMLTSGLTFSSIYGGAPPLASQQEYQPKNYDHLLGMPGFNNDLLKMHFKLYEGYVRNLNLLLENLTDYSTDSPISLYSFGALKRRIGWEFDGMRLHELYFGNLGGKTPLSKESPLYAAVSQQFGSFERWKKDFITTAMTRGIGWVILYRDTQTGQLINAWVEEHDIGNLATAEPLLVLDVWEHAYLTQYGLDRAGYIDTFLKNIDWNVVDGRFKTASTR